jgi:hypothetical protein
VAYVRKVRTASGAVAVQVARKDRGRVVILAHVGSAHTDAELGILLDEARQIVRGAQEALEMEVPARATRVTDVPDWRTSTLIPAPAARAGTAVGPGARVVTCSRLLYDVVGGVYDWLGFDAVADPVLRDLVIARIIEPTSKLDVQRVLADLGAELVSYKTIDRHARKIQADGVREHVVIADPPPPAAEIAIDGDEFEGGPSVRAGERPCHFEDSRRPLNRLHPQRLRPNGRRVGYQCCTCRNEFLPHHISECRAMFGLEAFEVSVKGRCRFVLHRPGASAS